MEVKPGYKQIEVGVIPDEWETPTLVDLVDQSRSIRYGIVQPGKYDPQGRFMIRGQDYSKGWVHPSELFKVGSVVEERYRNARVKAGDLIITIVGAGTGHVEVVPDWLDGANLTQTTARIAIDPSKADSQFCKSVLQSSFGKSQVASYLKGAAQPGLNCGDVEKFLMPLPPSLSEQRAIAGALGDMDVPLGALEKLIAKKRDLKQAAMQQLLTGQTRLRGFGPTKAFQRAGYGSIPDDWSVRPFKLVSSMNGRIGWQGLKQEEFTENPDDPFLITGMNFKDGNIRWEEVYHIPRKRYQEAAAIQLQADDVLMTKDGTIGKLLYVDHIPHPGKASLNSHLLVFRPIDRQYSPKFLFYQLGSPAFAQHIELHKSGSTFFGLTQEATGKYPVILPSLSEQTAIAEVLSDMDAELAVLEQRLTKTRALKQGMMQELLTGRIRLV